jgi:hypothetical protein
LSKQSNKRPPKNSQMKRSKAQDIAVAKDLLQKEQTNKQQKSKLKKLHSLKLRMTQYHTQLALTRLLHPPRVHL